WSWRGMHCKNCSVLRRLLRKAGSSSGRTRICTQSGLASPEPAPPVARRVSFATETQSHRDKAFSPWLCDSVTLSPKSKIGNLSETSARRSDMPFVVAATYRVKEGEEGKVAEIMQLMTPLSRQEPGCLLYQAHKSAENPRVFF